MLVSSPIKYSSVPTVVSDNFFGKKCGQYSCYQSDIERAQFGDKWFEGSIISVVAEALFRRAGESTVRAVHLSPLVLYHMRSAMRMDGLGSEIDMVWLLRQVKMVSQSPAIGK